MAQSIQEPVHVWLVMMKAMRALTRYAAAGIRARRMRKSNRQSNVERVLTLKLLRRLIGNREPFSIDDFRAIITHRGVCRCVFSDLRAAAEL